MASMKRGHLGAWLAVALGGIYFLAPLERRNVVRDAYA
jgi:hypothetical protein